MKIHLLYEKLAAPAQRALQALSISELEDLSKYTREFIAELHGIGANALKIIEKEMAVFNIHFLNITAERTTMDKKQISSVDEYIQKAPPQAQEKLKELRQIVQASATAATEKISYQIPTFYLRGNLVHFAAYEKHIGFYPGASAIAHFKDQLTQYKSAKGSVQFPIEKPLPVSLIKKIVKFRVEENLRKATEPKRKTKS
jgi:uncharacterized protein YdhG (YjbR/CyaY superfamily)